LSFAHWITKVLEMVAHLDLKSLIEILKIE